LQFQKEKKEECTGFYVFAKKLKKKKCFKNIEIKYFMRRYARSVNSQKRNISHQHKHSRSRKDAEDGENV